MEKTRQVPETYRVDDITGAETRPAKLTRVDVMLGDESGTLELTEDSRDALVKLIHGDDAAWRKLFGINGQRASRPKTTGKPRTSRGTGENAQARAWAETPEGQAAVKRLGITYQNHGQAPKALKEAWRAATGQTLAA
jgi:hypothetical protein